jgi:hypothetical protein
VFLKHERIAKEERIATVHDNNDGLWDALVFEKQARLCDALVLSLRCARFF